MKDNKTILRISTLMLSALCLLTVGCNKKTSSQSESLIPEEVYHIERPTFNGDFTTYEVGPMPSGINMTYYSDIYSRGFSWVTDKDTVDTELYLVQSDKGEQADFSNAEAIIGESHGITYESGGNVVSKDGWFVTKKGSSNGYSLELVDHKVHVENLEKGKAYSYKIGSEAGYSYGAFIVEKEQAKSITAIHLSDAQTKVASKLEYWRNTYMHAVTKAGDGLDLTLYNGDQFDQNMGKVNSSDSNSPNRFLRYTKALDVIQDYKFNTPYMTSSGNHEPSSPYCQYFMSDIKDAVMDDEGLYYSFDYDYVHFVVLNTNSIKDAQIDWLKSDLDNASDAKWKVVMMHISPYSSGDHSNKSENQSIVEKLTPIFSSKHVDLVLQAHDHTYNKTLPYRWDAAGYTTTYDNDEVVNLSVEKETLNDVIYDKNPQGTYYVTTGAAGHRNGADEADGIWAEVTYDESGNAVGLDSNKTFLNNKYKIQMGTLTQTNQYTPCSWDGHACDQTYNEGELATGNVNAAMFGVLDITESTLAYHVYTVNGETVKLFDTLDVLKN